MFGLQWYADEDRENHAELAENARQELSRQSDDRRQREDNRLENLRFVRERASTDPNENRPFANLDLESQFLGGLELRNANLSQARLSDANMNQTVLIGADLKRAQLVGATLQFSHLNEADFTSALLVGTNLTQSDLSCDLVPTRKDSVAHQHVCRSELPPAGAMSSLMTYKEPESSSASFRTAYLVGTVLHDASLIGADFWGARLNHVDLRGAKLKEASLVSVISYGVDFSCISAPREDDPNNETAPRCANLTGAALNGAKFRDANFSGANLSQVTMDLDTDLTGADMTGTILEDICYQAQTTWPRNFVPPPARLVRCMTDKSLEATIDHVKAVVAKVGHVGAMNLVTPRCARVVDQSEWLDRWRESAEVEQSYRIQTEKQSLGPSYATVKASVTPSDPNGHQSAALGNWVYSREANIWQFDGC